MEVKITNWEKCGEGVKSAYILYTITSSHSSGSGVRRRFGDFVQLHSALSKEYPACVVPPIPSKSRLEYLDRFTDEFVEKRKVSLERFLNRLLQHPLISQSQYLKRFIYEELWFVSMAPSEKEGVLESVSESWMNAFSKVKKPDERFLEIQNTTTIYEENLKTVEKNVSKLAKLHDELGQDLQGLSAEMGDIGALEAGVTDRLQQFSNALNALGEFSKNCCTEDEKNVLNNIHDQIGFCASIKDTLKQRDQKQIDFESLSGYLNHLIAEKERLENPGRSNSSLSSFFRDKFDEIKGGDPERTRQERIVKLEHKIQELRGAVDSSHQVSTAFSEEVLKEVDNFEKTKVEELKSLMIDYTRNHLNYLRESLKQCESLMS